MKVQKKKEIPKIIVKPQRIYAPTTPTPESISKEKAGQGKKEFISMLRGNKLTLRQGVKAFCYTCMGYYADGTGDCGDPLCPLHSFMPYAAKKTKKEPNAPKRVITKEQLEKMQAGRKKQLVK